MPRVDVRINTGDGDCPASVFTPEGATGPWPGAIFFMDGPGIRPSLWQMGQRLSNAGYLVLLPDLFYRSGPYAPLEPAKLFSDPALLEELRRNVKTLDRDKKIVDAEAFIGYLGESPEVAGERFGATGYCMGGNFALTAAGAFPDRFAAIASFHGGNLATEQPDSPHRFVRGITGRVYVAGAIEDSSFPDEQKARLEAALSDAGVDHLVETYEGARHGWAVPDMPTYNEPAAERHWTALLSLFADRLAGA